MKLPLDIYSGAWNGGHCQGIALDTKREYIYYSYTTMPRNSRKSATKP